VTQGNPGFPGRAPADESALVVGIEAYPGLGDRFDLPGTARSAARFARWLLDRRVCRPERLTLMLAYDKARYEREDNLADCSPEAFIADVLAFTDGGQGKVNFICHDGTGDRGRHRMLVTDEDFTAWVNTAHAPRLHDRYFHFFFAGHGFRYLVDRRPRLCLLGADADPDKLRNVVFEELLGRVEDIAPGVHQVAFMNTCRAPIGNWAGQLKAGIEAIPMPHRRIEPQVQREPTQSILYAAAEGETTKMSGWQDMTFADVLLDMAEILTPDELPNEGKTRAIFTKFNRRLRTIGERLQSTSASQGNPTVFEIAPHRGDRRVYLPVTPQEVRPDELALLLQTATSIDDHANGPGRSRAYWGAYAEAVGLTVHGPDADPDPPAELDTLEQLVHALYSRRPTGSAGRLPPLVTAMDYIARLPDGDSQPALATWCDTWAGNHVAGEDRLIQARQFRQVNRLPTGEYLSVLVKGDKSGIKASRYQLHGLLWSPAGFRSMDARRSVTADGIVPELENLINQINQLRVVGDLPEMIIELVLPRELIGRHFEYEADPEFGIRFPVVIRDLERLHLGWDSTAIKTARTILECLHEFRRKKGRRTWSSKVAWIDCGKPDEEKRAEIRKIISERKKFCLVLEHGNGGKKATGVDGGLPHELVKSIEYGAAIVVSLWCEGNCRMCDTWLSREGEECDSACQMPHDRKNFEKSINKSPNGLLDLPSILKNSRDSMLRKNGLKAGVLMDDDSRLWPQWAVLTSAAGAVGPRVQRRRATRG
jgi:vWA-MoxR associated protein C-terminal domain